MAYCAKHLRTHLTEHGCPACLAGLPRTPRAPKPATEAQVDPWALLGALIDGAGAVGVYGAYINRTDAVLRVDVSHPAWLAAQAALEAHRAATAPRHPTCEAPGAPYRTVASHAEDGGSDSEAQQAARVDRGGGHGRR